MLSAAGLPISLKINHNWARPSVRQVLVFSKTQVLVLFSVLGGTYTFIVLN